MKICIYADPHFCQYSSIVRKNGTVFSTRLENLIQSIEWVEQLAVSNDCDKILCLGDFFDKATLNAIEVTALSSIHWSDLKHEFLVGNHEALTNDLKFNTTNALKSIRNSVIIDRNFNYFDENVQICYLPYTTKFDKISDIFGYAENRIVFSHNNIKGIQYGKIESKDGFDLSDIDESCNLFLNGHLHNSCQCSSKLINLGNLTGQNFSENADVYGHFACILNTNTLELNYYQNPYAFNFYSVNYKNGFSKMFKNNSVVMCNCNESDLSEAKMFFDNNNNIIAYRFMLIDNNVKKTEELVNIPNQDYSFRNFINSEYDVVDSVNNMILEVFGEN